MNKWKTQFCLVLSLALIHSTVFAGVPPQIKQEEIDHKFKLLNLREMSDEQILTGLKEIQALIDGRMEEIASAEMKGTIKAHESNRPYFFTVSGLSLVGFVVGMAKESPMVSSISILLLLVGGTGAQRTYEGNDVFVATLHDTQMTDEEIGDARSLILPLQTKVNLLRQRMETHLGVELDRK